MKKRTGPSPKSFSSARPTPNSRVGAISIEERLMFSDKNKEKMTDAIWVVLVLVAAVLAISLIGHGAAFGL
jgi:hypothetical protein